MQRLFSNNNSQPQPAEAPSELSKELYLTPDQKKSTIELLSNHIAVLEKKRKAIQTKIAAKSQFREELIDDIADEKVGDPLLKLKRDLNELFDQDLGPEGFPNRVKKFYERTEAYKQIFQRACGQEYKEDALALPLAPFSLTHLEELIKKTQQLETTYKDKIELNPHLLGSFNNQIDNLITILNKNFIQAFRDFIQFKMEQKIPYWRKRKLESDLNKREAEQQKELAVCDAALRKLENERALLRLELGEKARANPSSRHLQHAHATNHPSRAKDQASLALAPAQPSSNPVQHSPRTRQPSTQQPERKAPATLTTPNPVTKPLTKPRKDFSSQWRTAYNLYSKEGREKAALASSQQQNKDKRPSRVSSTFQAAARNILAAGTVHPQLPASNSRLRPPNGSP